MAVQFVHDKLIHAILPVLILLYTVYLDAKCMLHNIFIIVMCIMVLCASIHLIHACSSES